MAPAPAPSAPLTTASRREARDDPEVDRAEREHETWERRAALVRWSVTSLAIAVLAVVVTAVVWRMQSPETGPARAAAVARDSGAEGPVLAQAVAQVRQWDAARAAAWSEGSVPALRRLYTGSSVEGRTDAAALEQWTRAGWKVEGVAPRLEQVEEVSSSSDTWVVDVLEQEAHMQAVNAGRRVALPAQPSRTRRITFVHRDRGWVVARVRSVPETVRGS